ncbi:hypothetical protein BTVI_00228 [Pitangus sulphuratus]|nr:hypothetical protein BTVI_00228 [Pitangus sulphuratus]
MPADFPHWSSGASNMALRPPPAVRPGGRSGAFGPLRSRSAQRRSATFGSFRSRSARRRSEIFGSFRSRSARSRSETFGFFRKGFAGARALRSPSPPAQRRHLP